MDLKIELEAGDGTVRLRVHDGVEGEGLILELPDHVMHMIFLSGMEILTGSMVRSSFTYCDEDLELVDKMFPEDAKKVKAS